MVKASSYQNKTSFCNGITLTLPTLHVEVESFDCSSFECVRVKNKRKTATREKDKMFCISVSLAYHCYGLTCLHSYNQLSKSIAGGERILCIYTLSFSFICHKVILLVTFVKTRHNRCTGLSTDSAWIKSFV